MRIAGFPRKLAQQGVERVKAEFKVSSFVRGPSKAVGTVARGGRGRVNTQSACACVFRSVVLRGAEDLLGTLTIF